MYMRPFRFLRSSVRVLLAWRLSAYLLQKAKHQGEVDRVDPILSCLFAAMVSSPIPHTARRYTTPVHLYTYTLYYVKYMYPSMCVQVVRVPRTGWRNGYPM